MLAQSERMEPQNFLQLAAAAPVKEEVVQNAVATAQGGKAEWPSALEQFRIDRESAVRRLEAVEQQIRSMADLHRERDAWKRTIEVLDQKMQQLSADHQENDVAGGKKARTAGNA
jgi:hypothetical protein